MLDSTRFFLSLLLAPNLLVQCHIVNFTVLLITQPWHYELEHVRNFERRAAEELDSLYVGHSILKTHSNFEKYIGSWGIWSILTKLSDHSQNSSWILIAEPFTQVDWKKLLDFTNGLDPNEEHFLGRALSDRDFSFGPVIIHHYFGFQGSERGVLYPDFAAGVLLSRSALKRIVSVASSHEKVDFTIDAKHEFAKFISDSTGIELENMPEFCLLPEEVNCITLYRQPEYSPSEPGCGGSGISKQNVAYAIKTYSGFHKTRVVVVKRTWVREIKYVEFYSDVVDTQVPTIDLGVPNTERGHCQKTFAIFKHFLDNEEFKHINWLVVTDDDTLLNVDQLHKVINCLPDRSILGERYGFGFEWDGIGGYDYPTGGSGFVLSRAVARFLAFSCECPSSDSPDDMIIGLCARRLNIPILHSAAFHQAQRRDYDPLYIKRITPISFHKFENIDPYSEYIDHLKTIPKQAHTEL